VVLLLSGARTEELRALGWEHVHIDPDSGPPYLGSWIGSSDTAAQVRSHSVGHHRAAAGGLADRNQSLTWWAILGSNQ